MSTAHPPQPDTRSTSPAPSGLRPRRRGRAIVLAVGTFVAAVLAFPFIANAAMSTFAAHDHGTLAIFIDGEPVDLDQSRFHDLHPEFHIHPGHGNMWHHHPENVTAIFSFEPMTLRQALSAMGIDLGGDTVAFDSAVYDTGDSAVTATVHLNATEVDPDTHIIGDGDNIAVEVTTR